MKKKHFVKQRPNFKEEKKCCFFTKQNNIYIFFSLKMLKILLKFFIGKQNLRKLDN